MIKKINALLEQYFTVPAEECPELTLDIRVDVEEGEFVVKEGRSFTTSDGGIMTLYKPISGPSYRLAWALESGLKRDMGEEWFSDLKAFLEKNSVWDYTLPNIEC